MVNDALEGCAAMWFHIVSTVNFFIGNSGIGIINYTGVIVFVALTAFDTQKLEELALS